MAQTETTALTKSWGAALVSGPCAVTLTPDSPDCFFALREDAGLPADTVLGHLLVFRENTSMQLASGTSLHLRGSGNVSWSKDDV